MDLGSHFSDVCGAIQKGCLVNRQMLLNVSYVSGNENDAVGFKANAINVTSLH